MIQTKTYQVPVSGTTDINGYFYMDITPYIPLFFNCQLFRSYFVSTDILQSQFITAISVQGSGGTLILATPASLNKGLFGEVISIDQLTNLSIKVYSTVGYTKVSFNMNVTLIYIYVHQV